MHAAMWMNLADSVLNERIQTQEGAWCSSLSYEFLKQSMVIKTGCLWGAGEPVTGCQGTGPPC